MQRRTLLRAGTAGVAGIAGLTSFTQALAQAAPSVFIWSGFPAGGLGDQVTRPMLDQMRGKYPQPLVYDSKPGAGGRISAEFVRRSAPDGNNILQCPTSVMVLHPHVFKTLPYNTLTDFAPVAGLCTYTTVFTAGPGLPESIRTVAEYLQWAKANPPQANYGVPAVGSSLHLAGSLLSKQTGVALNTIPFQGGAPLLNNLLGGHVPVSFNVISEVLPHIRAGRLRALAITAPTRSKSLPEVPTFTELGHKEIAFLDWLGWYGPAGMPAAKVASLNAAVNEAMTTPAMVEVMERNGLEVMRVTPEQLGTQLRETHAFWGQVVKTTGFTPAD